MVNETLNLMQLSTLQLRNEFKIQLSKWENGYGDPLEVSDIKKRGIELEEFIQLKIKNLALDFANLNLHGEYSRTVSEGFDDLNCLLTNQPTFLDLLQEEDVSKILHNIQLHYSRYIVPLFNIIAKLENDYTSFLTGTILTKRKNLDILEEEIKGLKKQKLELKKQFFSFNKKDKSVELSNKIKVCEFKLKFLHLSLYHDKLNLYYFSHERPPELNEVKARADKLKIELQQMEIV